MKKQENAELVTILVKAFADFYKETSDTIINCFDAGDWEGMLRAIHALPDQTWTGGTFLMMAALAEGPEGLKKLTNSPLEDDEHPSALPRLRFDAVVDRAMEMLRERM